MNGEVVKAENAYIHVTDLALLRGFGIFDFCRTLNGTPFLLDRYLTRFFNSAKFVDLEVPFSKEEIKDAIYTLYKKNKILEAGIRLVLTGGYTKNGYTPGDPNIFILVEKIHFPEKYLYEKGIKLMLHEHQRELSQIKSINYLTPISIRKKTSGNEAYDVLYHKDNLVLEVSRSNIFIVKDNVIITPYRNILTGITRGTIIKLAKEFFQVKEQDITTRELIEADEVFMTGTTKKVLPVRHIDEHIIGSGKPGPVTKKLIAIYSDFENSFTTIPDPGN